MSEFIHILERFSIHLFAGGSVYLLAFAAFDWLQRKKGPWVYGWAELVIPGLVAFLLISLRESWDVYNGQLLIKVVTDWLSWVLGIGLAVWGQYRMAWKFWRAVHYIRTVQNRSVKP